MSEIVHVAVAVITNDCDQVCISLRDRDSHQGGLWEFPGGKVEPGETVEQALCREIKEELDLEISASRPLIKISHDYQDKKVCLHVRNVLVYQGKAIGVEGQQVKWVSVSDLSAHEFPAANNAIIKALRLPERYLITGNFTDEDDFSNRLSSALRKNISLVQLRLKQDSCKDPEQAGYLIGLASSLCERANAKLMLNIPAVYLEQVDLSGVGFAGFHADSRTLQTLSENTSLRQKDKLFSASCHSMEQISLAARLDADFIVLSPVQKTSSHPDMMPMGWQKFSQMVEKIQIPVYALGGVSEDDMEVSWSHGAQGIAAISAYWY